MRRFPSPLHASLWIGLITLTAVLPASLARAEDAPADTALPPPPTAPADAQTAPMDFTLGPDGGLHSDTGGTPSAAKDKNVKAEEAAPSAAPSPEAAPQETTAETTPQPQPEVEPAPIPAAPTPDASVADYRRVRHDPRVPIYQRIRPQWGMHITGSLKALGTSPSIPNLGDSHVRAFSFQMEFQPAFLQTFGVLGVGPSFALYPIDPFTGVTSTVLGLTSFGGQVRYQFRIMREQPIVPFASFGMEYMYYRLAGGQTGHFIASGPSLGGMLLLNIFDPSAAAEFYVDHEITRSYLVAEFRNLKGSDALLNFSGQSLFFGLRFEF